jgi:protein phosphatase
VGAEEQIEVQKLEIEFRPGDLLLLCSDGLHGVAGDRTIQELLRHGGALRDRCEALIEATLEKGAPDNITAVLVERTRSTDSTPTGSNLFPHRASN